MRLKDETERERLERESQGLSTLTSDDAKMFHLQVTINNKSSEQNDKKDVLYIESIVFLLQTLVIKV